MKKKINIFLLLLVLGLWGVVAYRSLNNFFFTEVSDKSELNATAVSLKKIEKDSFELIELKRNPFTNKPIITKDVVSNRKFVSKTSSSVVSKRKPSGSIFKITPTQPKIIESNYDYKFIGTIKNQSKGEMVVIRINDKIYNLFLNVKQGNYLVKKIYKDSVLLISSGEKIMVKK